MGRSKLILSLLMAFVSVSVSFLSGCNQDNQLLLLNWGEYLNDDVIVAFEEETGYEVIQDIADSNELFYSKIKSGTTAYDLVFPSEYMVEKMVSKDLLQKIDYSKLTNYDPVNNPYMDGVIGIQSAMFEGNEDYGVPYFWGTFGLMYNKNVNGLEEKVISDEWKPLFDPSARPVGTRVAMYSVPRFSYAAAMFYLNESPNVVSDLLIESAYTVLRGAEFDEWGTDTLKKGISADNLDLAFVYTGDFLDMLYTRLDDGDTLEEITFDIHIPNDTIAFMDSLVIPKRSRHVDIAHEFIDFLLRPEIAYMNASTVGYATPLKKTYEMITENIDSEDPWLSAWAYANLTYYPLPKETDTIKYKGIPLSDFDQSWLDKIATMTNNVKV